MSEANHGLSSTLGKPREIVHPCHFRWYLQPPFTQKKSDVCHGADGSGTPGPDVTGESASEIARAPTPAKEEVHAGITASSEEVEALAAFLSAPSPLPVQEVADFSDPRDLPFLSSPSVQGVVWKHNGLFRHEPDL